MWEMQHTAPGGGGGVLLLNNIIGGSRGRTTKVLPIGGAQHFRFFLGRGGTMDSDPGTCTAAESLRVPVCCGSGPVSLSPGAALGLGRSPVPQRSLTPPPAQFSTTTPPQGIAVGR